MPKKRPKQPCWESLKELDIYGIDPQLVVGGKSKFRSWWGVCFSLLAMLTILFYTLMKVLFFIYNSKTNLAVKEVR